MVHGMLWIMQHMDGVYIYSRELNLVSHCLDFAYEVRTISVRAYSNVVP